MKNKFIVAVVLLLAFTASSCGKVAVEPVPPESQTTGLATEQPASAPTSSPEDVINNVIVDSLKVYEETAEDLKANNGRNIGTEYDRREVVDEGVKYIASDGENPFMPLAKRLNEAEGVNENNQAFYMKFKPSAKDFGCMLSADANVGITIGDESEPVLFVMDHNYMEALDTSLRIEPGSWYHVFLAMGSGGLLQGAIWKDGEEDAAAYMNLHINASFNDDRYAGQSWQVNVGYQGEATFTVDSYAYYTFSNFVMPDRILEMQGGDAPDVDYSDPMSMVATILNDARAVAGENTQAMTENMGGQFGGGVAVKQPGGDGVYFQFISDANGALTKKNESLNYGNRGNTQAMMIKFQPESAEGLTFTMMGMNEIVLQFEGGRPHFINFQDAFKAPYSDYMQTDFALEGDKWYWAVMAFDANGNYRSLVWEDGNGQNCAYCTEPTGEGRDDMKESNWQFEIGFGPNQTLNIQEYSVLDFESFVDGDIWSSGRGSQGVNRDPMEIINGIVMEPQVLYRDDLDSLPERGYSAYSDVADKNPGDGFEFRTDGSGTGFTFLTPLLDVVPKGERKDNMCQALLICFRSMNPAGLRLDLTAQKTAFMSFAENGMPAFGIVEQPDMGMLPFEEQTPNGFALEAGKWYYAFIAIDINSNLTYKVWEMENSDNYSYYRTKLAMFAPDDAGRDEFRGQNWTFGVKMGHNSQFNMQEFSVMDFAEFIQIQ